MSAQNRAGVPPQETGGTTAANDVAVAADPAVTPGGAGAPDGGAAADFGHSESRGDARPVSFARRVAQQPTAKLGFLLTGLVLLVALLGPFVVPAWTGYGPNSFAGKPFQPGVFGTDNLGRDVLSRFLEGGWRLLLYSALATVLGVGIGAVLGMLAAFRRGWLDAVIMRSGDVLLAIPQLVFALLAITVLGPQGWVLVLVIGITHAPRVARVIRSATAGVVAEDYVLASQMYAVPQWKILGRDVVPNIMGPLMVEVGLRLTYSIGAVASLSFLGLGMQPPTPDWGLMINENRIALSLQPWGVLLPVIAIAVLTVGTNLLADAVATASAGRVRTTAKKGA
ncbi:ABC transporter permease [Kocuria rhizophila]|uniref:ABC transporter permease n=1 Tax=Kocuria TaxID=57493 RepID=UPI001F35FDBF|nr:MULTISPECIES: ABC transporter permease [Kocuria]MCR4526022.1 ABC transporter permease [Kocuria rhizophila]MCT1546351.1 ABC transporter permease [Kocuria rhizophila]MCT2172619.1 ABC transporter permease [Kocuria rhizophila]MDN3462080.1 ABC transporter permease [Kocuria sp. APC 4018]